MNWSPESLNQLEQNMIAAGKNKYEIRDAKLKAAACKDVYQRNEWVQWSTPIPNDVGQKIIDLLAPYCRPSHGEASFGYVIDFPDGRYMIIGTTDDDVGDGFTWIMFNGAKDVQP